MIENESKVSLAVKPPNLPIPDHLASFVQSPVRVLGANTAVCRRRLRPDEENALPRLLKPFPCRLPFNFLSHYFRQYISIRCFVCHASGFLWLDLPASDRFVGSLVGCPPRRWKMLCGKQACLCLVLRRKFSPGSSLASRLLTTYSALVINSNKVHLTVTISLTFSDKAFVLPSGKIFWTVVDTNLKKSRVLWTITGRPSVVSILNLLEIGFSPMFMPERWV